jgi:rhodanese-related sulfurtransferase
MLTLVGDRAAFQRAGGGASIAGAEEEFRAMPSRVTATPTAPSDVAAEHFARRLSLETDCDDVHGAMLEGAPDFVLLDVRGPGAYARAHVPGALNLPQRGITAERMAAWPEGTVFVVYCAGPHCNGADKAALALARLGRPAKVMIGGMTGWADEGFASAHGAEPGEVGAAVAA